MNNNTNETQMKVCTLCHLTFVASTENFNVDRKGKLGLASRCKECMKKLREPKKETKRQYDENRKDLVGDLRRKQAIEYYWNNKEKKSEYDRKYRLENPEKRKLQKQRYYLNNKEYCLRKSKENREANKEHYLRYRMNYYQENKVRIKKRFDEWRRKNKDKFNINSQRRKARKRKLESNYTEKDWLKCKKHFNNKCAYCGKSDDEPLTQEHFIPIVNGGEYTVNNIIPACKSCNCSKRHKDFYDWYPLMPFYSVKREQKILKYLNYKEDNQQLALFK